MLLRTLNCGLLLLATSEPYATPPPQTLLSVMVTPGYTSTVHAELTRGYPLCLLRQDGTLIASEQTSRPGEGMYYRAFTGVIPAADLAQIQKALPLLLPPQPKPGSEGIAGPDSGSFAVHMQIGAGNEERRFLRLEAGIDELLRRAEMSADERTALDARIRFVAFVDGLRRLYCHEVYMPKRARVLVEVVAGAPASAAPPWLGAPLSLIDLHKRCGTPAADFVDVTDPAALAALAKVVSSRQWSAGGAVYCLHWTPVIEM